MRRAAHGAPKAKRRGDSLLSLFVARHGSHGVHSVRAVSHSASQTSASNRLKSVAVAANTVSAAVASSGEIVQLTEAVSKRLQEIAPQSRREIRLARVARERRRCLLLSSSLVAMVGAVATTMSLSNTDTFNSRATDFEPVMTTVDDNPAAVSRSTQRESLDSMTAVNNAVDELEHAANNADGGANAAAGRAGSAVRSVRAGRATNVNGDKNAATVAAPVQLGTASTTSSIFDSWNLGSDASFNITEMSRSAAHNPNVALLMDKDFDVLPKGFNPNHDTGDVGNAYDFSQCTWWVYVRRHQLGLPVGSHMGNGNMWADSARGLGYWVDRDARHVGDIMVFRAGQAGSDPSYGHVAIVEKINPDGSIETSESGASYNGRTYSRKFDAKQVSQYQFIHY